MGMTKMKSFSQKESVLLGYGPQSSFMNSGSSPSPNSTCNGNSDMDFDDVFGGPPRRSSMPEMMRQSFRAVKGDDEEPWTGLSEKPVFGASPSRRRYPSHDFFNDIFRGDDSPISTPRKQEWDSLSSTPASRVLSPAHPLPPKAEPFGTSSLLSQFSLPPKLSRGTGLPTFGSFSRSPSKSRDGASNGISLSRFSSPEILGTEDLRNDIQPPYCQSLLAQELSLSSEELSNLTESDKKDIGGLLKKESERTENATDSSHFHFSIYKWASKGVPLKMPIRGGSSRSKERVKSEQFSRTNGCIDDKSGAKESSSSALRDAPSNDLPYLDAKSSRFENYKPEKLPDEITSDKVKPCNSTEEAPGLERLGSFRSAVKGDPCYTEEANKTELKPLCSLFFDSDLEQGSDEIAKMGGQKETMAKSTKSPSVIFGNSKIVKKQDTKGTSLHSEANDGSFQSSPVNSRDNQGRNRVKGRVKEFVKLFNQDASPKTKNGVNSQSVNAKWKENSTSGEGKESISTTRTDEKWQTKDVSNTPPHASVMEDENVKKSVEGHTPSETASYIFIKTFGSDNSSSNTGSLPHGFKAAVEETYESIRGSFQIKEVHQDENELPRAGKVHEEIQAIDAKIRQWKKGKEGNIRSLLSTLQYVLWPESGWKPVPLVDIIEGNSVKRAYQKALLCLHPDKLQQKGAASHQKYIAEKVFDSLQSWDMLDPHGLCLTLTGYARFSSTHYHKSYN
ncbi:hypothetical protein FNV43_RR11465 [Rhamnella rubrinervis]|uniref:J domain-containing protein required for chloroplast accumulation response 1 n=1 Tax=Rhamnella rubrinervis TaxID=2594499 RepID=A0A8K0MHM8_9ROSA|nr:hypothetical protein FNV43_RR11465 [Rhamnella rubrinervis]